MVGEQVRGGRAGYVLEVGFVIVLLSEKRTSLTRSHLNRLLVDSTVTRMAELG